MKNLIMKLSAVLAITCGTNAFANDVDNSNPVESENLSSKGGLIGNYKRLIVVGKDRTNVGLTNPTVYIDPLHQRMLSLGYYTQADVDNLVTNSIAFINEYYGIDVTQGVYNPNIGSYATSQWIYFPLDIGRGDHGDVVAFDSDNLVRGVAANWFANSAGAFLFFLQGGTFPGGINAGKSFIPGDGVLYVRYDLLKLDSDWTLKQNREQFLAYGNYTGKQFLNMDGSLDSVIRWECIDEDNNVGKALITNIYFERADGTRDEVKRNVITWE